MDVQEFGRHFADVLDAKDHAANGDYCHCEAPDVLGTMCHNCKRLDRDIEIEQVLCIVSAHDFQWDQQHPEMCHVCTNWEPHHRHHGVSDVGRLRDGTEVRPRVNGEVDDVNDGST